MRVSEKMVLMKISDGVLEECPDLHSSPDTICLMQSRGNILMWRVALMGRAEMHEKFWWGNLRIILILTCKK